MRRIAIRNTLGIIAIALLMLVFMLPSRVHADVETPIDFDEVLQEDIHEVLQEDLKFTGNPVCGSFEGYTYVLPEGYSFTDPRVSPQAEVLVHYAEDNGEWENVIKVDLTGVDRSLDLSKYIEDAYKLTKANTIIITLIAYQKDGATSAYDTIRMSKLAVEVSVDKAPEKDVTFEYGVGDIYTIDVPNYSTLTNDKQVNGALQFLDNKVVVKAGANKSENEYFLIAFLKSYIDMASAKIKNRDLFFATIEEKSNDGNYSTDPTKYLFTREELVATMNNRHHPTYKNDIVVFGLEEFDGNPENFKDAYNAFLKHKVPTEGKKLLAKLPRKAAAEFNHKYVGVPTGDSNNMMLYMIMMAITSIASAGIFALKRR